jgi:PAS domain S-box-containing protein
MRPETSEPPNQITSERDAIPPMGTSDTCTPAEALTLAGNRRRSSIRRRLASLVVACVLPVWIAAGFLIYYNYQSRRALTEQRMLETARALTMVVDRELSNMQSDLRVLATSRSLASGDLPAFYHRARFALEAHPDAVIVLSDATGQQLVNTFLPFGELLPKRSARDAVRQVFATGKPLITNVFEGAVTGHLLISVDVPVFRDNRVIYDLAMTVPADRFATVLLQQHLPPEWLGGIFDSNQVIVARTRSAHEFVGRQVNTALRQRMRETAEGTAETTNLEGVSMFNGFSRSETSGWTVSIGVPKANMRAEIWRWLWWTIAGTALLSLTGVVLALLMARRISGSIQALIAPALALGKGEPVVIRPLELKETQEVGESLTQASHLLQRALRQASEYRWLALEAAGLGAWEYYVDTGEMFRDERCLNMYGVTTGEQFNYNEGIARLHPDDREATDAAMKQALTGANDGRYQSEFRVIWPDGSVHWLESHGCVYFEGEGHNRRPLRFIGVGMEITKRKKAEKVLLNLNRTLKAIHNTHQALLHAIDETALLEQICAIITQDCGHAMMWIGFAEDDRDKTIRLVASAGFDEGYLNNIRVTWADTERGRGTAGMAIRTGKPNVCRDILTDPNWKPWREQAQKHGFASSVAVPLMDKGKAFGAITIYSGELDAFSEDEVTLLSELADDLAYGIGALRMRAAHVQAQEKVRRSQELLEVFVTQAPVGLAMFDRNMRYVRASNKWCEDKGLKQDTIRGKCHYDLFPDLPEHWKEAHCRAFAGESPQNEEDQVTLDGKPHTLRWKIHPWGDSGCETGGIIIYIEDITDRKRTEQEMRALEQQLRQAQKMEAVGKLAGGIAHDFNNLLMVIQSYTEILQQGLPTRAPLRKNTQEIMKATDRAVRLTRQMLAFSRKQVLSPVVLDLNAVVDETAKMLRRLIGEDIELRVSAVESLWAVEADSDQVVQVLMNLCVNARDAMPQGGTLTIATENVKVEEGGIGRQPYVSLGDYVRLSVADTGTGISKEIQEQIFDPFFTTKEVGKGTGLGLSTVYGIVKQSGGYVWVDSELGQGACFTIYLPRVKRAIAPDMSAKAETRSRGTETILVAEDEEALREAVCDYLSSLGYAILAASSGQQALSVAIKREGHIDLLITDLVMPKMSGRELAQMLGSLRPELKTIYMSGYTDDGALQHGIPELGAAFLQKPFSMGTLARKVRDMLARAETVQ